MQYISLEKDTGTKSFLHVDLEIWGKFFKGEQSDNAASLLGNVNVFFPEVTIHCQIVCSSKVHPWTFSCRK